ncbi:type IV pilin [Haloarchaeobius salinus]|uniref:type IV pilin n=1 Tax=Haloarchaeobius salinus TaxID=1198298 RepID=UPI00210BBB50|nr:type IV pilin [Haloarchaeobius salinus]
MRGQRGVSSVVATVLLIAVVLVVAVAAANFALSFADSTQEPAPQVHASMDPIEAGDGYLNITKNGGDELRMSELEIQIRNASGGGTVRLVDLPASGPLQPSNFEGDAGMVDNGSGVIVNSPANVEWTAGDEIGVQLPNAKSGDRIVVRIIHPETDSIVWEDTVTVS